MKDKGFKFIIHRSAFIIKKLGADEEHPSSAPFSLAADLFRVESDQSPLARGCPWRERFFKTCEPF
jgi:hypothetical protein